MAIAVGRRLELARIRLPTVERPKSSKVDPNLLISGPRASGGLPVKRKERIPSTHPTTLIGIPDAL